MKGVNMNCTNVKAEIDQLLENPNLKLSVEAENHLSECTTCNDFYQSTILTKQIVSKLKSATPVLTEPDKLTEKIMLDISIEKDSKVLTFSLFARRLLAAASICLFAVFGYEQFVVLSKINHLEKTSQSLSRTGSLTSEDLNRSPELIFFIKYNFLKKEYVENQKIKTVNLAEIIAGMNKTGFGSLSVNQIKHILTTNISLTDLNLADQENHAYTGLIESVLHLKN